jgi:hypothetical protein
MACCSCTLYTEIALSWKLFGIGHMYVYTFLLRMIDTMTSRNIVTFPPGTPCRSWDRWVGIVSGYKLDGLGLIPGRGKRYFSHPLHPDWLWHSLSPLPNGYRGVKEPGHGAHHLAPSSQEWWSYTAIPQYIFMVWYLIEHGNLYI